MEKTYTWIEAREVATNGAPNDQRSPSGTITEDRTTGIEGKKDKGATPTEAPILMITQEESYTRYNASEDFIFEGKEITFPSVTRGSNSSAPVIIKANIFERESIQDRLESPSNRGFRRKSWSSREIPLEITIGDAPLARRENLNFVIVRSDSPYNMLLGRTTMQKMGIVVSTVHEAIKFHTAKGIKTVFSTYESDKIKEGMKKVRETPPASTKGVLSCTKAEEKVVINDIYPGQTITIEKQLPEHFKERLRDLLSHIKPVKQKRRGLGPDRSTTACKEVEELTKVGILQKVKHQTWVANPVMAKKSNGGWRMCVDFTDINKACPKDCYPLPEIDWKVESLLGFRLKCFLDAYKGYHHIQMVKEDEDKTDFFAGKGVFCYRKMPFGLKNARATYQRLVDKVFHDQIGRNLEAYVDDMVIKSTFEEDMLADIKKLLKGPKINLEAPNQKKVLFRH
ncbi:reverse transcriptase domain-containing protein [Tanacetum coccineum]